MEGLPVTELSDEELERQGTHAHATRNWVFIHGTAEQFRTHTERMLALEQEYLRRHPKRTWQGSGGAAPGAAPEAVGSLGDLDRIARIRSLLHQFTAELEALLVSASEEAAPRTPGRREALLLARFANATGGSLHKLEAHQAAREVGADRRAVAHLYTQDPPLLAADREHRRITAAGRAWLDANPALLDSGDG